MPVNHRTLASAEEGNLSAFEVNATTVMAEPRRRGALPWSLMPGGLAYAGGAPRVVDDTPYLEQSIENRPKWEGDEPDPFGDRPEELPDQREARLRREYREGQGRLMDATTLIDLHHQIAGDVHLTTHGYQRPRALRSPRRSARRDSSDLEPLIVNPPRSRLEMEYDLETDRLMYETYLLHRQEDDQRELERLQEIQRQRAIKKAKRALVTAVKKFEAYRDTRLDGTKKVDATTEAFAKHAADAKMVHKFMPHYWSVLSWYSGELPREVREAIRVQLRFQYALHGRAAGVKLCKLELEKMGGVAPTIPLGKVEGQLETADGKKFFYDHLLGRFGYTDMFAEIKDVKTAGWMWLNGQILAQAAKPRGTLRAMLDNRVHRQAQARARVEDGSASNADVYANVAFALWLLQALRWLHEMKTAMKNTNEVEAYKLKELHQIFLRQYQDVKGLIGQYDPGESRMLIRSWAPHFNVSGDHIWEDIQKVEAVRVVEAGGRSWRDRREPSPARHRVQHGQLYQAYRPGQTMPSPSLPPNVNLFGPNANWSSAVPVTTDAGLQTTSRAEHDTAATGNFDHMVNGVNTDMATAHITQPSSTTHSGPFPPSMLPLASMLTTASFSFSAPTMTAPSTTATALMFNFGQAAANSTFDFSAPSTSNGPASESTSANPADSGHEQTEVAIRQQVSEEELFEEDKDFTDATDA